MSVVGEKPELFESRKADHIRLSLDNSMQALGGSGLERLTLVHEALPEIDFADVDMSLPLWGTPLRVPFFVSSMTAGHPQGINLNLTLARVTEARGWPMGVGSQRRQLTDRTVDAEWLEIRRACPRARFIGNIGLTQLIRTKNDDIRRLADTLSAEAMFVHTNPLQECLQPEGTPQFAGGMSALQNLVQTLGLPVILKETGCGFSSQTLRRLSGIGLSAVDVSGYGGTHWGRIEGKRAPAESKEQLAAETFRHWGIATVDSVASASSMERDYAVWASGGVRSGFDAAKLLAIGASLIGFAQPMLGAALEGEEALDRLMERFEFELKTAMFCTGSKTIGDLQRESVRRWEKNPDLTID